MDGERLGLTIDREQLERRVGRELTDDEVTALAKLAGELVDKHVLKEELCRISPAHRCRWCGRGIERSLLNPDVWWDLDEDYSDCEVGGELRPHEPR